MIDAFELPARFWNWLGGTNPDVWAAGAGWITALIAVVASIAAFKQVREARVLREEQAQPYVVAYMEPSQADDHFIDLVVKNFGTTAALDVQMTSSPTLQRVAGNGPKSEDVWIFDRLPVLVPGQEWRTFWDSGLDRKDSGLPDRHEVKVTYKDSKGRPLPATDAVLDWSMYAGRHWMVIYGPHHSAKALREIKDLMKKWTEFGGGLSVVSRDGDEKDHRRKKEMRQKIRRLKALREQAKDGDTE